MAIGEIDVLWVFDLFETTFWAMEVLVVVGVLELLESFVLVQELLKVDLVGAVKKVQKAHYGVRFSAFPGRLALIIFEKILDKLVAWVDLQCHFF